MRIQRKWRDDITNEHLLQRRIYFPATLTLMKTSTITRFERTNKGRDCFLSQFSLSLLFPRPAALLAFSSENICVSSYYLFSRTPVPAWWNPLCWRHSKGKIKESRHTVSRLLRSRHFSFLDFIHGGIESHMAQGRSIMSFRFRTHCILWISSIRLRILRRNGYTWEKLFNYVCFRAWLIWAIKRIYFTAD